MIPTGNKPCAEFLFEPIVGHNKHFGITAGSEFCVKLWEDMEEGKAVRFAASCDGLYLFKKCEKRSFDLKCRPWSRYMQVYKNKEAAETEEAQGRNDQAAILNGEPGINYFTKDLTVRPRLSCTSNIALLYTNEERNYVGELGYNCYCRQKECVELNCNWNEKIALKALTGTGDTTRFSKIDLDAVYLNVSGATPTVITQDAEFYDDNIIKESDLDLDSAAHPAYFSHNVYFSLGREWNDRDYPLFLNGAFSYEFGSDNAAMSRWLFWFKGGVAF